MHRVLAQEIDTHYVGFLGTHAFERYEDPAGKQWEKYFGYFRSPDFLVRFSIDRDLRPPAMVDGAPMGTKIGDYWYPLNSVIATLRSSIPISYDAPAELADAMAAEYPRLVSFFANDLDGSNARNAHLLQIEEAYVKGYREAVRKAAELKATRKPWWRFWKS